MSSQNKDWILKQSRAAVFYLTQCWSALWEIERLIESKGGDHWDVVDTFFKTQSMYLGRDLYSPDLSLFFDGLHEHEGMERTCQRSLQKSVGAEILEQLRKASWTYEQVRRIAKIIGHRTSGESEPQKKISKAGDRYLRTMMVQGAHYILGPFGEDSDRRRWGRKLAERGGKNAKKRAVVAVARKLAVLLHRLWVSGEVYEPLRNSQKALRAVA